MGDSNKQTCQLCLDKTPTFECETIDEIKKAMLEYLLININFDISDGVVACNMCVKRLQESFDFKSRCSTIFGEPDNKADVAKVFPKEMMSNDGSISLRISQVCRLCLSATNNECDAKYVTNFNDGVLLQEMIKYCFPEMDLSDVNEPVICKLCLNSLKGFYEFLKSCREVEPLCQLMVPGTAKTSILERLLKSKKSVELGKSIIKREYLDAEHDVKPVTCRKNEDIQSIKCEELQIKDEPDTREALGESVTSGLCNNSRKSGSLKRKIRIKKSTSKERNNLSSDDHVLNHRGLTKAFRCLECTFKTHKKYNLTRHMVRHKDKSKIDVHNCAKCTKREKCLYKTDDKSNLWRHSLKHKDKSEVEMHKCETCEYETRYKYNMNKHMRKHLDPHAEREFKCDKCLYETDYKSCLRQHDLIHKAKSEVEMHKCDNCDFETKRKNNMIQHMLKHRDPKAEREFKCDKCSYETDHKSSLHTHNLKHKDQLEVKMHKCDNCKYETRYKHNIILHMLRHRDPKAERKFKCDKCPYGTNHKFVLRRHNLIHKDKSEVKMHKCEHCEYETRYKSNMMKQHMLTHRDPGAERKFKCDKCPYGTDFKSKLHRHIMRHKDKSEEKMHNSVE